MIGQGAVRQNKDNSLYYNTHDTSTSSSRHLSGIKLEAEYYPPVLLM